MSEDTNARIVAEQQAASKRAGQVYTVTDTNQRGDIPRKHEVIVRVNKENGDMETMTYALYSDPAKGCVMPMEHAIKFLCDPAFRVMSPNGNRIMPIEKIDLSKPITKLQIDEVVVKYHALSRDYLFKLVKMLPGSEDVKPNATSQELADFMVEWRKSLQGMTDGEKHLAELMASGEIGGGMDSKQLDAMFGDRKIA